MASAGVGAADEVNVTFEGHFGGETEVVAVSGNYAYIGRGQDLVVLDVSSPALPVELEMVMTTSITDVTVSGDYAYVTAGSNGLAIMDVSNKSAPTLAGSYDLGEARGVAVVGGYAYVADWWNGLVILRTDASGADTTHPTITIISPSPNTPPTHLQPQSQAQPLTHQASHRSQ